MDFVVLERWLIATEIIDMRTFVENEGIFVIIGITTCIKTNKLCILKCIKMPQSTKYKIHTSVSLRNFIILKHFWNIKMFTNAVSRSFVAALVWHSSLRHKSCTHTS